MDNPNAGKKKTVALVIAAFIVVIALVLISVQPEAPPSVAPVQPTTTHTDTSTPTTTPDPTQSVPSEDKEETRLAIENAMNEWTAGTRSFEDTVDELEKHLKSTYPELAVLAQEQLAYIELEDKCNKLVLSAEDCLSKNQFADTFEALNNVDTAYSKYPVVEELYIECQDATLESVANPSCIEDFESFIRLLGDCIELYDSKEMRDRQDQLSDELVVFIEVSDTIQRATELYDSEQYEEAFITLALGIDKYPDDQRLASSLVDYHDHYIITVTKEAVALCEEKEYKDAQKMVEAAIEEYDCEEFQLLLESIKEQKSFLYRFKNDVVEKFNVMAQGWESEEFDVKQAASSTGSYIVKSGEKLFLGDYSEEDVTILTFGGNIVASLANVDFLFDLRDLTYDVIHWGEGECFAVYLATDVIALLPVVGVVKYFSHFKTVANGVEAANLVDSVGDVSRGAANAAEVADSVKGAAKTGNSIIEAVDTAKDTARVGEAAKDVVADLAGEYKLIKTVNQHLLGTKHPETGVEFVLKKLKYSNGEMIQGVFPVFDSFADITLTKDLYKATFREQKAYCLEQLQKQTRPIFGKYRKNFTADQLADIKEGTLPEGFVWHHSEEEGLMQLVSLSIHAATHHQGGMSLWGSGY